MKDALPFLPSEAISTTEKTEEKQPIIENIENKTQHD